MSVGWLKHLSISIHEQLINAQASRSVATLLLVFPVFDKNKNSPVLAQANSNNGSF